MSFRPSDLKKSVRKGRDSYQVTPARLEGRPAAFRIEFLLQQFEGHLGCPRRMLDPHALLDFVGDVRLGRGLLATLAQWYRVRPRTFAEVLEDGGARLREHGIAGPVDLRAWLYTAVNRGGKGYLDPESETLFWKAQSRSLGFRRQDVQKLMLLDRPEEAVLVRTGPPPSAADVMAAYNARAHTTLLRSAREIELHGGAPTAQWERAAQTWAGALDVEWRVEVDGIRLFGRADALGGWTRHGRRVERAALELLALPELSIHELRGCVPIGERDCRFRWSAETLTLLGQAPSARLLAALPDQIAALAALLRRERDHAGEPAWSIRRAAHLVAVEGSVCLPHLELRRGDLSLYLRLAGPEIEPPAAQSLAPFRGKTPVALVAWSGAESAPITFQLAGEEPRTSDSTMLLSTLAPRLQPIEEHRLPVRRAA